MTSPLERNKWLPREGFHADVLGRALRAVILNPLITIPLWAWFAFVPRGQQVTWERPNVLKYTRLAAMLSALRVINNYLDRRILNNNVNAHFDWQREIAIVTGGADGIGARVVHGLAAKGVKVVVLDIQSLTYQKAVNVHYYRCDITSAESVKSVAEQIRKEIGDPTILINNAGVCRGRTVLDATEADVKLTFEVNAISHYRLAREFVPDMVKKDHGIVATIASSAAWITAPRMTDYAASKAAALSFHEGLTTELFTMYKAPRVRTIVLCQGYTRTSLFQGFGVGKSFVAPALEIDTVAEALLKKIFSGTSGHVVTPSAYNVILAGFRGQPWWYQDRTRKRIGFLMENWKGRQVNADGVKSE